MFKAKDKNGQQIFLRDRVKFETPVDDMGLLAEAEGQVIALPSETKAEVQSLEGGAPFILDACDLVVSYSLVSEVANLSSNEELQLMIAQAEIRYDQAVKDSKPARKTRTKGTRTKKVEESMFD